MSPDTPRIIFGCIALIGGSIGLGYCIRSVVVLIKRIKKGD